MVTDSRGGRVTDLQPAAFEVLQDGKPQTITNFSYVSTKPAAERVAHRAAPAKPMKGEVAAPASPLRAAEARLGRAMIPGQYVLQVIVTDKLGKSKFATATQSTEFEIEP